MVESFGRAQIFKIEYNPVHTPPPFPLSSPPVQKWDQAVSKHSWAAPAGSFWVKNPLLNLVAS